MGFLKYMKICVVPAAVALGPVGALFLGGLCAVLIYDAYLLGRFIGGEITTDQIPGTFVSVEEAKLLLAATILSSIASLIGILLMFSFTVVFRRAALLIKWFTASTVFWTFQVLVVMFEVYLLSDVLGVQKPLLVCFAEFETAAIIVALQEYAAFIIRQPEKIGDLSEPSETGHKELPSGSFRSVKSTPTGSSMTGGATTHSTPTTPRGNTTTPSTASTTPSTMQSTPSSTGTTPSRPSTRFRDKKSRQE